MPSAPQPSEHLVTQLRQQLILAQVRIMELEDIRDEITPKLTQTESLLGEAQVLVEDKVDEATHLAQVRADLQKQFEHLQHVQHVTNTALEETRRILETKDNQLKELLSESELLQAQVLQLTADGEAKHKTLTKLESQLSATRDDIAKHIARIQQLDTEQCAMKSSRSWRWTAWLRSIERRFR